MKKLILLFLISLSSCSNFKHVESLHYSSAAYSMADDKGQYTIEFTLTSKQLCSNKLRRDNEKDDFQCIDIDEVTFDKLEAAIQSIDFEELLFDDGTSSMILDGPSEEFNLIYEDGTCVSVEGYSITLRDNKNSKNAASLVSDLYALMNDKGE